MRRAPVVLGFALVAGCASGSSFGNGGDATGQQDDAPLGIRIDAATHDAHVAIDARVPIDARPDAPPDAHPDARPIDARPIDAPKPVDACVPVVTQLLANPAFDLAPLGTGWTQVPIEAAYPPITASGVHDSVPDSAWMGGFTGSDEGTDTVTDQVYQNITIPADTTALVITGMQVVGTTEDTSGTIAYDTASIDLIQTDGTPIENVLTLSNLNNGTAYTAFTHTFTHLSAGMTVQLRLTTSNDITNYTNFFFDTLALKATHCP